MNPTILLVVVIVAASIFLPIYGKRAQKNPDTPGANIAIWVNRIGFTLLVGMLIFIVIYGLWSMISM